MKKISLILLVLFAAVSTYLILVSKKIPPRHQTAVATPTPSTALQDGWKTYTHKEFGYSLRYPEDFKIENNGDYSILIVKDVKPQGAGPTNFVYVSVLTPLADPEKGEVYNYKPAQMRSLLSMKVGDRRPLDGEAAALAEYITFTRLPDTEINGIQAKTYVNSKPWEFPAGTKEYRYVIELNNNVYLVGGYATTGKKDDYSLTEEMLRQIVATFVISKK